jgi:methylglyoxal/glyoxal reductase
MPLLGLGTFKISNEDVKDVVKQALDIGYRHIDTAQMYGNEEGVGFGINASSVPRESIFITSKQRHHMSLDNMKQAFFQTLNDLQTEYLDLYLIHWPNHDKKINQQSWAFFEWLYEQKLVRAIGVSNFQIHHLNDLFETAKIKPHVNQVELHPALNQAPLNAFLKQEGIQIISYGPFMKGGIMNAPFKEPLEKVASKYKISIHQLILAWGQAKGIPMIPKTQTHSRLIENYQTLNIKLNQNDIDAIDAVNRGVRVYTDPDNNPWGIYQ